MPALTPYPLIINILFEGAPKTFYKWREIEDRALELQTDEELREHFSTYDVNAWAALDILTQRHNKRLEGRE